MDAAAAVQRTSITRIMPGSGVPPPGPREEGAAHVAQAGARARAAAGCASSVKAAVHAGARDSLQRLDKGGGAQRDLVLGVKLPDGLESLAHDCGSGGRVRGPHHWPVLGGRPALHARVWRSRRRRCMPPACLPRGAEEALMATRWKLAGGLGAVRRCRPQALCSPRSSFVFTSSSLHLKFCRFCTHSKKLTLTPPPLV